MTAGVSLESQLDELRSAVATLQRALNAQPRLSLVSAGPAPYLGQSVSLILTAVRRSDSEAIAGVPVTLVTSWGVLRGEDELIEGSSITAVTGPDGTVRCSLRPRVTLEENEDQDALEVMLEYLDPDAVVPRDAKKGLEQLAKEYKWEANQAFRVAIDAYFRDFGAEILRTAPFFDYMNSWSRIPATVIALAAETDTNTSVAASITCEFRNWLGPWLQVFSGLSDPSRELQRDFGFARDQAASAAGLIAAVFDRTTILVDNEYGDIGKKVAQQAAQRALENFVNTGLKELSVDVRRTVGPILATGARALSTAGEVVVAALGQTHAAANTATRKLGDLVSRAELADAIAVKADRADLVGTQNSLATKTDLTTFQKFQTQITADLTTRATAADLKAVQNSLAGKLDESTFRTFERTVNDKIQTRAAVSDLQALQTVVNAKADTATLGKLTTRISTLEGRVR